MPTVFFFLAVQGDSIVVGPSLLQAGDHIVLTRRETGGLRRSHAAGHVRALHLMDMQSAVNNVEDLAQMEIARRYDSWNPSWIGN